MASSHNQETDDQKGLNIVQGPSTPSFINIVTDDTPDLKVYQTHQLSRLQHQMDREAAIVEKRKRPVQFDHDPVITFNRPHQHFEGEEQLPVHLEEIMDYKKYIDMLTEDQCQTLLGHLEQKWIIGECTPEELREHAYRQWGMSEDGGANPMKVYVEYNANIYQTVRLYAKFVELELVGDKNDDSLANTRRFSRILELIKALYDMLLSEHRSRAICAQQSRIPVPEEVSLFDFSFPNYDNLARYQKAVIFLLRQLSRLGYRRFQKECYKQIITEEGFATHAWTHVCSLRDFVYQSIQREVNFEQWNNVFYNPNNLRAIVNYLQEAKEVSFPDLEPDRRLWSFRNGIWDARENKFHDYREGIKNSFLVTSKYFDLHFDYEMYAGIDSGQFGQDEDLAYAIEWFDIPTPSFSKIMIDQGWEKIVQMYFFALCGRMMFEVGKHDDFQVLPFVKGVGGSGKSTLGKALENLYPEKEVGIMSNNIEKKFGLSQIMNKKIFICYEAKRDFGVSQAELQNIISGESVSLPVKNLDAVVGKWTAPGIFFGNEVPNWLDASNCMGRRLACFECPKVITQVDQTLSQKIAEEMPRLIYKFSRAYEWLIHYYRDEKENAIGFWTEGKIPQYFLQTRARFKAYTHPLICMMGNKALERELYIMPTHQNEIYMPLDVLKTLHNEFCKVNSMRPPPWNNDYCETAFQLYGLRVYHGTKEWNGNDVHDAYVLGVTDKHHFKEIEASLDFEEDELVQCCLE